MKNKTIISVVICTYNNEHSLSITLDQLLDQQENPGYSCEFLIIDNNSKDNTRSVCEQFVAKSRFPAKYLFEHRQGLSHARNTGVNSAAGEYILFTDDDADIPKNWIYEYFAYIEKFKPDCLYSKISIRWDRPKPWWFTSQYTPYFVGLDYGDELIIVQDLHKEFFGKNFCMKRQLILNFGGFDPALGRSGSKLLAGEETILYRKMIEHKRVVIYFPSAEVGHRLKDREYSEENIRNLFIDGACSAYHIARLTSKRKVFGRPLGGLVWSLRNIVCSALWFMGTSGKNNPKKFYYKLNVLRYIEYIRLWLGNR